MKNTLETRLGMFVALAMVAAFIILEILGGQSFFKPGYHLRARFNNVQDLKVGNAVKMAGVPVGQVEKIELKENKVEVTLKLDKEAPVHTDSKAIIKFTGLMGQYYVSIDFGNTNTPKMAAGQYIATEEQPDLNALMAKLDDVASGVQNITRTFSGDNIDNIVGPLVSFMKENSPRLTAILANFQTISRQIAEGQGSVGKLINDDAFYVTATATLTNLQDAVGELKTLAGGFRGVLDQINSGQGTAGLLVKDETLYRETASMMTNLNQIMMKMNSGQGTVGQLINNQEFYKNAKLSLQKIDKATESLEDSGPLSLIGQIVTTLF